MANLDFLQFTNLNYLENLTKNSPKNSDWESFLTGMEVGESFLAGPRKNGRVKKLVRNILQSYRLWGYLLADINPLTPPPQNHPLLKLSTFGLQQEDLDQPVNMDILGIKHPINVRTLLEELKKVYSGPTGLEFLHITDSSKREWLIEHFETQDFHKPLSTNEKFSVFSTLVVLKQFQLFLNRKYVGQKRFSIEGSEALIPLLNELLDKGSEMGAEEFVIGMAHRGRLDVLAHVAAKPFEMILSEFEETPDDSQSVGEGDVKYHLGFSSNQQRRSGKTIHVSVKPNPSHLEMINPVIEGLVYAKQRLRKDNEGKQVIPILIHGETAFTGQGIVSETLALSGLSGYHTGGTLHVIIDNQLGFTAEASQTRTGRFATEIAKIIDSPIFHVNCDYPEQAIKVARLAMKYRQRFGADVFINLVGYRKHGHNEGDEPTFTQPKMYHRIKNKEGVTEQYIKHLTDEGILTPSRVEEEQTAVNEKLESCYKKVKSTPSYEISAFEGRWKGYNHDLHFNSIDTTISRELIKALNESITNLPKEFSAHPKIIKGMDRRRKMGCGDQPVDWATAEAWSLASLLHEGTPVRLTGQDTERGTFSQRHAVLHDYESGDRYTPLKHLSSEQACFEVLNSPLSELAVLGFEFGISYSDPRTLVAWEAQFGDFVNDAQPIIDLFIASSEAKWKRLSGIVLLLPHGYEGQGPDHSSARLERFLQLCAQDNMQVCYPTLPAQYFHLLRRQMHQKTRRPLIVMTPKSLLRDKRCVSTLKDFETGGFNTVLASPPQETVKRVMFCSGRVFYPLESYRQEKDIENTLLLRIEQLYPFPQKEIKQKIKQARNADQYLWVQEEPKNMGAWSFMASKISKLLPKGKSLQYVGRPASPSPATGWHAVHKREEETLIEQAFSKENTTGKKEGKK